MKTATKRKSSGNRKLGTIEMTPRGNLILRATKNGGNLEVKASGGGGKRQWKAGGKRGATRARRSSSQTTMEAAH
jgi:hypothetical protein